jgi:hypothetical protein
MKKRWNDLKGSMKNGGPLLVATGLAIFGVVTGIRRSCELHDEVAGSVERHFRKAGYSDDEIGAWILLLKSGHAVGHYHRARHDTIAFRSVMGSFREAMKGASVNGSGT